MPVAVETPSLRVAPPTAAPLLSVQHLKTYFPVKQGLLRRVVGHVRAVDDVSFQIQSQQTLGLVGESGCGKSTVGRTILRLVPATAGTVQFDGHNVLTAGAKELRALRRHMQIVFQDPVGSLNPRMTVEQMLSEPMRVHGLARGSEVHDRVATLLKRVGLLPVHARRYPHEFSGGQRQRIGIARALSLDPKFIVCDEPVSALDVSIQAQILNLLSDLKQDLGLSYLFIAHNLSVIRHFCDDVAVMYLGWIVEISNRKAITTRPRHPYTQALISAAPQADPTRPRNRIVLTGEVPSPIRPPAGCVFHPRCELTRTLAKQAGAGETVAITVGGQAVQVMKKCLSERPPLEPVGGDVGHCVACFFKEESGGGQAVR